MLFGLYCPVVLFIQDSKLEILNLKSYTSEILQTIQYLTLAYLLCRLIQFLLK